MKQRATVKIMMSLAAVAMFVLTPSVCAATAQKPPAKKTSLSETELRTLAKTVPDVKNAGQLYSVALATSNDVARQQEYLKAAAAGLIACGKTDIYRKHVKGKLQNAAEFEDEVKDDCKQCSGAGLKERRCSACRGKGQCSTCKGTGQTMTTTSFSFGKQSKPCTKCNESGQCPKCGGEGSTKERCLTCGGTGKAFSKTIATRVFRDSCNAIADGMTVTVASNHRDVNPGERRTKPKSVAEGASSAEEIKPVKNDMADTKYKLGMRYLKGDGVAKDAAKAVELFHIAAEQGYAKAQFYLGVCYSNGEGVSQDKTEAVRWFRKAADQGIAQAQYNLGLCCYYGKGVPQDMKEVVKWLSKAADQGLAQAQDKLGRCYLSGKGVPQDKAQAAELFEKAAVQGYAPAQGAFGVCCYTGAGVPQDIWLRQRIDALNPYT